MIIIPASILLRGWILGDILLRNTTLFLSLSFLSFYLGTTPLLLVVDPRLVDRVLSAEQNAFTQAGDVSAASLNY